MAEEIITIEQPECSEVKIKVFAWGIDFIQDGSIISFDMDAIPVLIDYLYLIHDKSL